MDIEKDYYKILGVSEKCSQKDIKEAYKKLALEWHPDKSKNENAMKIFKDINEAYRILHHKKRKTIYDRYRKEYKRKNGIKEITPDMKYKSKKPSKQSVYFDNILARKERKKSQQKQRQPSLL